MNPRTLCALCRHRHKAHSVRGFLSIAAKKQEVKIASLRNEAGQRVYKLER
jgi:hypothetical protein